MQPGFRLQMPFQGFRRIERFSNLGGEDNPIVIHSPFCMAHVKRAAAEYLVVSPKRTAQKPHPIDLDLSVLPEVNTELICER
ncbi:hypothetical protein EH31_17025 [Erythrobacter longus]|uniref:Uncharacterized protein n=1 Tax=Erythrobacter longus TaxID=1044 RepID=A0A074MSS7_ERYLO|nr:hypothetical protein EH31_17025 [Erythrobacter longus]